MSLPSPPLPPLPTTTPLLLVDTDVLIEVERGNETALTWWASLPVVPSVPGLVVLEFLQGAQDKRSMTLRQKLVNPLPVVWPTTADGDRAISIVTTYCLSHKIGAIDAMIAAIAIGLGATLCSRNRKHYQMIPGLSLMKPF